MFSMERLIVWLIHIIGKPMQIVDTYDQKGGIVN